MNRDRFDALVSRVIVFCALGMAPLILAGELVRGGRGPLGVFVAYGAGALVWSVTRRDR